MSSGDSLAVDTSASRISASWLLLLAQLLKAQIAANLPPIREKSTKKTTKMVDIFVLIVGVSQLPKFTKIQPVIGSSKNI